MGMKTDFFKHARNMSLMSDFSRSHTGCVVIYKNKIIGAGFNTSKTHPIQRKYNWIRFNCESSPHCMHAEVNALCTLIHDSDINWNKVHIYVYREHKNGIRAMARPCASCMQLIKDLGIRNIHYTTEDGYAYEVLEEQKDVA